MNMKGGYSPQSDLSRIAKNAGISATGEVVSNVIGYVTNIIITRLAGAAVFGIFSLANNIINIAQIFSSSGPGHGLLRFVSFYKGRDDTQRLKGAIIFGTNVASVLSLSFSVIIFYSADLIANKFFHDPEVGVAIRVLAVSLPFLTIGTIWLECIQSFQVIKYHVLIKKILQPSIRLILTIILFLIGWKLMGILAASVVSVVTGFFLTFYYLVKIFPFYKRLPAAIYERREILSFSIPASLTQYFGVITLYADSLMLGYFKTAIDVGVYSAALRVALLLEMPLIAFNTIFGPMISEFYARNEMRKLGEQFKIVTKWIFSLSLPLYFLFILFSRPIMEIFGQDFTVGATALIIFGGCELINVGTGPSGLIIAMTGRSKLNLLNAFVFGVLNIILNYLLIPPYGIKGAAISTGISIAVVNILRVSQVYFLLGIHPYRLDYLKPIIAGLLSLMVVTFMTDNFQSLSLSMTILFSLLFLAFYGLFLYLFKFEEEDRYILQLIRQKLNNVYKNKFK